MAEEITSPTLTSLEAQLTSLQTTTDNLAIVVDTLQNMLAALVTPTTVEDVTTYTASVTDATVAAAVWAAEDKVVSSVTNLDNLTVPTAAEVAQAVWNNDIVSTSLRTVTATEAQLPADTVVQADVSPDAIAGIAAAVWGYNATGDNARTLTSNVLTITDSDGEVQTLALT